MAKFTRDDVMQVIEDGRKCVGADLQGLDLSGADLSYADLSGANLTAVILQKANLTGAKLQKADLFQADLKWADLSGALDIGKKFQSTLPVRRATRERGECRHPRPRFNPRSP